MANLTDSLIKSAIKQTGLDRKTRRLSDGTGRGVGRLILRIRIQNNRLCCDWFAAQFKDYKQRYAQISTYPYLSLKEARYEFQLRFAAGILRGKDIRNLKHEFHLGRIEDGSFAQMCVAYVEQMKSDGKPSWKQVQHYLLKGRNPVVKVLGTNRLAKDVVRADIVGVLAPIFQRGSIRSAERLRSILHSAFQWAMQAENDYRTVRLDQSYKWSIAVNPVDGIPLNPDAYALRKRALSVDELRDFWHWCCTRPEHGAKAARLILLLGCRVQEATNVMASMIDTEQWIVRWEKTKNGRPHVLPLAPVAKKFLQSCPKSGFIFPELRGARSREIAVGRIVREYCKAKKCERFQARDLRRTWRTHAGNAGIERDMCGIIQNHAPAQSVVGWASYDRAERLDVKLEALKKWEAWLMDTVGDGIGAKCHNNSAECVDNAA